MDKLNAELEEARALRAARVAAYVEEFTGRENNVCLCIRHAMATRWRGAELLRTLAAAENKNAAVLLVWEMTGTCTQAELTKANKDMVRAWTEITEWFQRTGGVHNCGAKNTAKE
jgi:hypothetical protein